MARLFVWIGRRVGAGSALTIMILAGATPANGAGLQLLEVSPRLTGTAYSGTAAWGADASMAYFNPAGLTLLEGGSFVASGYIIDLDLEVTASKATTWGQNIPSESNVVDGGSVVAVPQFHFAQRISDEWVGYLGVTVPFGNDTNYPDDGVTRYVGTLSALRSISINPAIAWEPIEGLSVAAGFNAQVVRARINQKLAVPTLPIMQAYDINSRIFADDWGLRLERRNTLRDHEGGACRRRVPIGDPSHADRLGRSRPSRGSGPDAGRDHLRDVTHGNQRAR